MTARGDPDECTPLLQPATSRTPRTPCTSSLDSEKSQTYSPRLIVLILTSITFILSVGGQMTQVPGMRIMEDIICHHYYARLQGEDWIGINGYINESLCKADEIQSELNTLVAGQYAMRAVPGFLVTIPYGMLADRIGRKRVFAFAIFGEILTLVSDFVILNYWKVLPLRAIWLSPMLQLMGGGEKTSSLAFYAIVSDVMSQKDRANAFLFASSAGIFGEMFGPAIAARLMKTSPWIPMYTGLSVIIFGLCLILTFLPETLHLRARHDAVLIPEPFTGNVLALKIDDQDDNVFSAMIFKVRDSIKHIYRSTQPLHSLPILLLLIPFFVRSIGGSTVQLGVIYISKRFFWTLAQTGLLLSLRAAVNIILVLGILPTASHYLLKTFSFTSDGKDLFLASISGALLFTGPLIIGASPIVSITIVGLIIYTLGLGFHALVRSLLTTLVVQENIGSLFAAISMFEVFGLLLGGPGIAYMYAVGLKLKGAWLGLPFFCFGSLCFVAASCVWTFAWLTRTKIAGLDDACVDSELLLAVEDE